MSKITFDYEGAEYTLEFDRETISAAETAYGITLNSIREAKVSTFPGLFRAAFMKHHPRVSPSLIDEMYERMPDKSGLFVELVGMYADAVNSILAEPAKGKAINWAWRA